MVRFDRFHARRVRAGVKAATSLHEISEAQLGVFRALLPMPAPATWLYHEPDRVRARAI